MLFGFQDDGRLRDRQDWAALDQGKAIGGQALRLIIARNKLARTTGGGYDFSAYDNVVNQARQRGIRPQLVLDNRSTSGMGDPAQYARFVALAAHHFKGRVGTYSLGNEPDLKMSPDKYRQLFVRGQKALGRQDRSARVLFGELSPHGGLDYARKVIGRRGLTASGFAIHPYQGVDPLGAPNMRQDPGWKWGIGRANTMQRELAQLNLKTRANKTPGLYFTEFGYNATNPNAAAFWPRALQKARNAGVKELIAYTMTAPQTPGWDTALLNPNGTPRPAYTALARALAARR